METANAPKPANKNSNAISDVLSRLGIIGELFRFLWARKLWWLIPMIIALLVFGILMLLASSSILAPFIYPLV
jgi:hypothetical protein